ncbi:MAG: hypothetical protein AAGU74_04250 [Bacillota bacterium]
MKRTILALLCILIVIAAFPASAGADFGPKPSVVIDFKGLEGKRYYATLLSDTESTGPFSAFDEDNEDYARYQQGEEGYDIFQKFVQYQDNDGFYFLQYFEDCSQTQRFSWTYYPPDVFKVLLYFPDTDSFVVSDRSFKQYAFDSYFTADGSGLNLSANAQIVADLRITQSYDYGAQILSLLARIVLTIAIELGIALLFGFREKRLFRFIVIVNVITQIALNVLLNIIDYQLGLFGFLFFYVLLEIAVSLAEAILYAIFLKKLTEKKVPGWKPWVYALVANALSFALGMLLALWIPGIV